MLFTKLSRHRQVQFKMQALLGQQHYRRNPSLPANQGGNEAALRHGRAHPFLLRRRNIFVEGRRALAHVAYPAVFASTADGALSILDRV